MVGIVFGLVEAGTRGWSSLLTIGSLAVTVQGRSGFTPYVRWGNTPVVLAALALLALCVGPLRRKVAKAGQYR